MQMWNLGRFLPLAVGSYVSEEDKHWKHFLLLLDIMEITFSRKICKEMCGYLEALIDPEDA